MSVYEKVILAVDDDRELLKMLDSIFQKAGYRHVLTASSGREALMLWKEKQPELLILDVMMPGMDGLEVLRRIRRTSRVPVLMLTARGEAEDRIAGLETGADDYLAKPFLPKELLLRVGAILQRAYPERNRRAELAAATVDLEKAEVTKAGERIPLTASTTPLMIFKIVVFPVPLSPMTATCSPLFKKKERSEKSCWPSKDFSFSSTLSTSFPLSMRGFNWMCMSSRTSVGFSSTSIFWSIFSRLSARRMDFSRLKERSFSMTAS